MVALPQGYRLATVDSIEKIEDGFVNEYVYDIDVSNDIPYFFANDILVHNSAYVHIGPFMINNEIEQNNKNAVLVADHIGAEINTELPEFAGRAFLIPYSRGAVIQAKRESVIKRALFKNAKKRYALYVIDSEGKACDDIKVTGMEVKRTDTPKYVQKFLEQCISYLLKDGWNEEELGEYVNKFRDEFDQLDTWRTGIPCGVSNVANRKRDLETYWEEIYDGGVGGKKPNQHFSVKASLNTNKLMDIYKEHRWDYIKDGDKVEILYLKKNEFDFDSVAIKVGEDYVPEWFKDLPFDVDKQEEKLITNKLANTFGILGWDFIKNSGGTDDLFS